MPELTIYDSQGREYPPLEGEGSNERISDLFLAGARFTIEPTDIPRITLFFRAQESPESRSEQFYALYEGASVRQLIAGVTDTIQERIAEYGLTIDREADDMTVFNSLTETFSWVGTEPQREIVGDLLDAGQPVTVGVNDYRSALGVYQECADRDDLAVAVVDDIGQPVLSDYGLVVTTGDYERFEFLESSRELASDLRQQRREREVSRSEEATPKGQHTYDRTMSTQGRIRLFLVLLVVVGIIVFGLLFLLQWAGLLPF